MQEELPNQEEPRFYANREQAHAVKRRESAVKVAWLTAWAAREEKTVDRLTAELASTTRRS